MRINRLTVYQAPLRYAGGEYRFSHGRAYTTFTTTVIALHTDEGLTGYGESCPCGPAYMPGYAAETPQAIGLLAPHLLGKNPLGTSAIAQVMERELAGHELARTAIDLACWDLLGKAAGLPVHALLGGRLVDAIPLHRVVPLGTPEETLARVDALRAEGFAHFQVKLGHDTARDVATMRALDASRRPGEVFVGDANTAWRRDEALRVSAQLANVDCYLEQPCAAYDACRSVRRRIRHPVKLDEALSSVANVRRAISDDAMDAAAIKLTRFGGLTRARIARDLCADAGIAMTIEDAWGGTIVTAAIAHLAASTEPAALLNATDLHRYNGNDIAEGGPECDGGIMRASDRPGLGVAPDIEALGDPVAVFR